MRVALGADHGEWQKLSLGQYRTDVLERIRRMDQEEHLVRLWRRDAALWKDEPDHQEIIRNSLGWLRAPETLLQKADKLISFADEIRQDFRHVLVLGMGGSSLCPEVLRRTFGKAEGYPELLVLDSTDPASVKRMEDAVNVSDTLFVVASKSGTTTEPLMFYHYFFDKVSQANPRAPGKNLVAVTDPGTKLDQMAQEGSFRHVFRNMPDIGGRYSALSFFGMVPAALMGVDIRGLLERARAPQAFEPSVPAADNPAARLGAVLSELARQGRDKVTFITPPPIDSLGLWIEQLIAESMGKEGRGIVPVAGEPLGDPEIYGNDRLFVYIHTSQAADPEIEGKLEALEGLGHPSVHHVLRDALSLGREFFLWELATALAGASLDINPFDQPNVQESKDNTKELLDVYRQENELPEQDVLIEADGCRIYADDATWETLQPETETLAGYARAHLARVKPGDYVALTAYIPETDGHDQLLREVRLLIRNRYKTATTVGYGPRFLHSTGQLHKGGADNGVFIQITADDAEDLSIPGVPYTFGVLKQAQALGDFRSLSSRGRRAIRFHLGADIETGLKNLLKVIRQAASVARG